MWIGPTPRRLDEEVEQDRLAVGSDDQHVAAGPECGQQRLTGERGEHRADRSVDGVSALAQHVRARTGGERVAGGDDA